jgi:hypothetical protein
MQKLLQNPSGPYSAYFARRDITIKNLNDRFMRIMRDNKGNFPLEVFTEKNDYYFYFKIPSETHEKLHYDVVIKFSPVADQSNSDMTLNNYAVNLFSNAPNFLFTYAYIYNQDGVLVDFLKEKINSKALNEPPNIKNPIQSYGFEKSVYFALLYIKFHRLNIKSAVNHQTKKLVKKDLIKVIDTTDDKLKQYNRAKANSQAQKNSAKSQKTVAKNSKTSYNEKADSATRKSLSGERERKLNMKVDLKHNLKQKPKRLVKKK